MDQLREKRREGGDRRGTTSDQDQDLLRAMLVFACAGLDAAIKALIRDALPQVADAHPPVQAQLDNFAARYLSEGGSIRAKQLAEVLAHASSPRQAIVEAFVEQLTGGSLQSAEELLKVCDALGVRGDDLTQRVLELKEAFRARNEVVHEMDLTQSKGGRRRRTRTIARMLEYADAVFGAGFDIVSRTTEALSSPEEEE